MKYDEIQSIKVDVAKKECNLKPGEYYIKKDVRNLLPGKSFFFASKHKEFVANDDVNPLDWINQFKNQIGFAMCSNGCKDAVRVKDEKDLDARNCEMSTVFTTL